MCTDGGRGEMGRLEVKRATGAEGVVGILVI